jgi:hypothetical protein
MLPIGISNTSLSSAERCALSVADQIVDHFERTFSAHRRGALFG